MFTNLAIETGGPTACILTGVSGSSPGRFGHGSGPASAAVGGSGMEKNGQNVEKNRENHRKTSGVHEKSMEGLEESDWTKHLMWIYLRVNV